MGAPPHAKVIAVPKVTSEILLLAQGKSINIIQHITFSTFVLTTQKANKCVHPRKQMIGRQGICLFPGWMEHGVHLLRDVLTDKFKISITQQP